MSCDSQVLAWDYTEVALAYRKRPGYAPEAIDAIVEAAGLAPGTLVVDVGAGTGNLAVPLLERGLRVLAVEPNAAMRRVGEERTTGRPGVRWCASRAEALSVGDAGCDAVTFGSSFNVVDRSRAIAESARVTKPGGSIACLWNHRRLEDPVQGAIEEAIRSRVPGYAHGSRREDPSAALLAGDWFEDVRAIEAPVVHSVRREDFLAAWASHLTLRRQAGIEFEAVLGSIESVLRDAAPNVLEVPYVTRAWVARRTTLPLEARALPSALRSADARGQAGRNCAKSIVMP